MTSGEFVFTLEAMKNTVFLGGLTDGEVAERVSAGQVNHSDKTTSRSTWDIVRTNTFTRFNALLSVLFVVVMSFGHPIDGLFFVAVIINSGMGIFQELRAKRALDKLTILNTPTVTVRRNLSEVQLASEKLVRDDIVLVRQGDQVPSDGKVVHTSGVEVDESLLTGEAEAVHKAVGETLLSGSIVVAGSCWFQATAVGDNSYANRLAAEVKKFTKSRSELLEGTNKLLGYISILIVVVAPVLVWGQLQRSGASLEDAAIRSVAAIVGMIPEGLVVLTSFSFVLASLALARRRILVQELPAVEGLARVDTVCLDKTGTLTEGKIAFDKIETMSNTSPEIIESVLGAFAAKPDSPTLNALHDAFPTTKTQIVSNVAFSSKRKWSAISDQNTGWVMGAPEILFPDGRSEVRKRADAYAESGERVMVLTTTSEKLTSKKTPTQLTAEALVLLQEKIRHDAAETLAYFAEQGVDLKVISGDNPRTVLAVARQVGIDAETAYDARELPKTIEEVAEVLQAHSVFGRVLPEQKRLFVRALQSKGHVVAMTGDGVNDALALKDADMGIAMGNGAPATRAIAQLVLLDNSFSHLPYVLGEGRRVIANIERVANLFLIKNVYNLVFALAVTVLALSFPFLPRHLSLISWLTIGIPAFFLALAPNSRRYTPGFLPRVLKFAIPVGLIVAGTALFAYTLTFTKTEAISQASSVAAITVATIGFWVLIKLAEPLKRWKVAMIAALAGLFYLALFAHPTRNFLEFDPITVYSIFGFFLGLLGAIAVDFLWRLQKR